MAVITIFATRYVRCIFSCRDRSVVARGTNSDDLCVIHHCRRLPERGAVAILAGVG